MPTSRLMERLPDITSITRLFQADGYSSETKLTITVNGSFCEQYDHEQDFEQQFSAFRVYDSRELLTAVQDGLIAEMTKEITDQIFNATVANW